MEAEGSRTPVLGSQTKGARSIYSHTNMQCNVCACATAPSGLDVHASTSGMDAAMGVDSVPSARCV